jgi:hypothetical protein
MVLGLVFREVRIRGSQLGGGVHGRMSVAGHGSLP